MFPGVVVVAVPPGATAKALMLARGQMRAISPEEPRLALVLAIARDIAGKAPNEQLVKWRRLVLSTVVEFRVVPDTEMFLVSANLRERIGADYEALYFSAALALDAAIQIITHCSNCAVCSAPLVLIRRSAGRESEHTEQ